MSCTTALTPNGDQFTLPCICSDDFLRPYGYKRPKVERRHHHNNAAKIQNKIEIIHNIALFFNKTSNYTNQINIKYTRYYTITLLHKEFWKCVHRHCLAHSVTPSHRVLQCYNVTMLHKDFRIVPLYHCTIWLFRFQCNGRKNLCIIFILYIIIYNNI